MSAPFPTPLHTNRLILRAPALGDVGAVNVAINESLEQLRPWMPWAQEPQTLEETLESLAQSIENWRLNQDFRILGFSREDGELVLSTGLHPVSSEVPSFHIGYWCRASHQGKGYVTEAVNAVRDAGFQTVGARRIEIRCDVLNYKSQAVAERCGFRREGVFQNDSRDPQGSLRSTVYYALTQDDEGNRPVSSFP